MLIADFKVISPKKLWFTMNLEKLWGVFRHDTEQSYKSNVTHGFTGLWLLLL